MYVEFISDEYYKDCVRYVLDSFNNAVKLKNHLAKLLLKEMFLKVRYSIMWLILLK